MVLIVSPNVHTAVQQRFSKSCSITEVSASVDTSPKSCWLDAIFRSTRLMILPVDIMKNSVSVSK